MESIGNLAKRAPRWAWYTAGGVAIGGFALRMYRNRTTADGDTPDATTDAETIGSGPAYGVSGASPGVIVPPVIISGGSVDQSGTGLGALQELAYGGIGSAFDAFEFITGGLFAQNAQLVDAQTGLFSQSIAALAAAGGPPQPVVANPTPVVAYVPAPTAAPAPAPAPANPCAGKSPYIHFNPANGDCYTVACAQGIPGGRRKGRWHLYYHSKNDQWMSPTC